MTVGRACSDRAVAEADASWLSPAELNAGCLTGNQRPRAEPPGAVGGPGSNALAARRSGSEKIVATEYFHVAIYEAGFY
jgi:hypothetical protein